MSESSGARPQEGKRRSDDDAASGNRGNGPYEPTEECQVADDAEQSKSEK